MKKSHLRRGDLVQLSKEASVEMQTVSWDLVYLETIIDEKNDELAVCIGEGEEYLILPLTHISKAKHQNINKKLMITLLDISNGLKHLSMQIDEMNHLKWHNSSEGSESELEELLLTQTKKKTNNSLH